MKTQFAVLCIALVPSFAVADDASSEAADALDALVAEYEDEGGAAAFAPRFFNFEESHRNDPAAVDALLWILKRRRSSPDAVRAIELLEAHHLKSDALSPTCVSLARVPSTGGERLLRAILEENPHADIRAQACYYLAWLLEDQSRIFAEFKQQPELADRMRQYYGEEYGTHLISLDMQKHEQQLASVYEEMLESFADVSMDDVTMGEIAERALFRLRNLAIGQVAPEIEGKDVHGRPFKLSDYRGKVVVLTFWGHW